MVCMKQVSPTSWVASCIILAYKVYSHFANSHFVNIDKMGIDKVGIDKVGSLNSGKICHLIYLCLETSGWMASSFLLQCGVSEQDGNRTVWCL